MIFTRIFASLRERVKGTIYPAIVIVVFAGLFVGGFFVGKYFSQALFPQTPPEQSELLNGENLNLFWQAISLLKERYVKADAFDGKKAVYGAIRGAVRSLEDPYTEFLEPQQATILKENLSGSFSGIGIEIGLRNGVLTVVAPLADTPADKVGLKAKDRILKIDGVDTYNMSLDEAVSRIRGLRGTKVTLNIAREDFQKPRDFVIVRDIIKITSISSKIIDGTVGYIKLNNFDQGAYNDFAATVQKLQSEGAQRYIVDLRNNPGGFLEVAVDLAGWFLNQGDLVVIEDFGGKVDQKKSYARGPGILADIPTVVLVNEGSASASEIFAGALRDNRGVQIVGERTFGKGSVQEGIDLPDGAVLKVTIANWLTPRGTIIDGRGIEPDVQVSDDNLDDDIDKQLDRAVQIVKSE